MRITIIAVVTAIVVLVPLLSGKVMNRMQTSPAAPTGKSGKAIAPVLDAAGRMEPGHPRPE